MTFDTVCAILTRIYSVNNFEFFGIFGVKIQIHFFSFSFEAVFKYNQNFQTKNQIFITVYKTDTSLGILALFSTSHIQVHLKNAILVAVVA